MELIKGNLYRISPTTNFTRMMDVAASSPELGFIWISPGDGPLLYFGMVNFTNHDYHCFLSNGKEYYSSTETAAHQFEEWTQ